METGQNVVDPILLLDHYIDALCPPHSDIRYNCGDQRDCGANESLPILEVKRISAIEVVPIRKAEYNGQRCRGYY